MINRANQILNNRRHPGGKKAPRRRDASDRPLREQKSPDRAGQLNRGSQQWIIVRTLKKCLEDNRRPNESSDEMFLQFAEIGRRTHIYWNQDILGHFGGTSNFLTGIFLRSCLRVAGLKKRVRVRFHPWITADAVERALEHGSIVLLQVYRHPKYKNHHMLCYACRRTDAGEREFLLADGWKPGPLWVDSKTIGHGHYLTIRPV